LAALQIEEGDKVLSIGSAGDNSFSMLTADPKLVVAVDINEVQLNLINLKKAAYQTLDHNEFLRFLGFNACQNRKLLFKKVSVVLDEEDYIFWAKQIDKVEAGIIHEGKFEKYFGTFRTKILPWIHSNNKINKLFVNKSTDKQQFFFSRVWNNLRWKTLLGVFFSRRIMGWLGRDPKFLSKVKISVGQFVTERATKHLSSKQCQNNYYLDYILRGNFNLNLPHYARKENYQLIKNNVNKLVVFKGYAQDAVEKFKSFNKFNLSNIFEYMDENAFAMTVQKLVSMGKPEARYAYWNLMVPRSMNIINQELKPVDINSTSDLGFFYSNFQVNQKQ